MKNHSLFPLMAATMLCIQITQGSCASTVKPKVIYGDDNRLDYYEATNEALRLLSESTIVLVNKSALTTNGDGFDIETTDTLLSMGFCSYEPFLNQPTPGYCSGFLVAPNIIVTAGHCISNLVSSAVVFGFRMNGEDDLVTYFPAEDVYYPTKVLSSSTGNSDWAVVQLDRNVVGRDPLPFRTSGTIPDGQSVAVVGYPIGLPLKIAEGAYVRDNSDSDFFVANTDTYGGNSGSAIVNMDTYEVEGVLVRGDSDYEKDIPNNCKYSKVCSETACTGEDCTRTTEWAKIVLDYTSPTETPTQTATPTPTGTHTDTETPTPTITPTPSTTPIPGTGYLITDFNLDGRVDADDLIRFIEDYGTTYPTPTPTQ